MNPFLKEIRSVTDTLRHASLADFTDPLLAECPYVGYPTGWFVVAWSHELAPGDMRAVHFFGQDLIVWRSMSGDTVVMDAYCPHLGCHLAIGAKGHEFEHGCVDGDTIICPFHGWRWDAEGKNVEIPYSTKVNRRQRVRVWPTREIYDKFILVWHDVLGREPEWEPQRIPELEKPDEYYLEHDDIAWKNFGVMKQPLPVSAENMTDGAHLQYVHGATVATSTLIRTEGPIWESEFDLTYKTGKNKDEVVPGHIHMESWGMGFLAARIYGIHEVIQIFTPTPTDGWNCELRGMVFSRRDPEHEHPTGVGAKILQRQLRTVDEDGPVFQTARYVRRPPFAPEEARPMMAVRRWFKQFYPLAVDEASGDPFE